MPALSTARVIERERDMPMREIFASAEQRSLSERTLAEDLGITLETLRIWMTDEGFEGYRGIRRKR